MLLLNKDTKFESNSQQGSGVLLGGQWCFYWTKIQNLKAILNWLQLPLTSWKGAFTEQRYKIWKQFYTVGNNNMILGLVLLLNKDTKFESNSQLTSDFLGKPKWCFYWTKIQNLKAILNLSNVRIVGVLGAFTEQRYKIWKQFSTQNGKWNPSPKVLLLNKDTKFESNSQPIVTSPTLLPRCFYWTKIQNLKAILNSKA